jgi:hypothetical protein
MSSRGAKLRILRGLNARRFTIGFALAVLAAGACALPSTDEYSSGNDLPPADAGRDAGPDTAAPDQFVPVDAGTDAEASIAEAGPDASDGLPPHGPNLIFNGGFEIGCSNWLTYNTSAQASNVARTGTGGCRVCAESVDNPQFSATATVPVTPNEAYFAEFWLHASPTDDASAGSANSIVLLFGSTENSAYVSGVARSDEWTRVGVFYTTTKSEASIKLLITFPPVTGGCVIFDDAAVYKLD